MNTWFRFYNEVLDDQKVQRLTPYLFKAWVNILCLASLSDGEVPAVDAIAFRLRMSEHDVQMVLDELIGVGLIDIGRDRKMFPHGWMKRQYVFHSAFQTSTDRVRKHRENKKKIDGNVSCNVSETLPDSETDSETEQNTPLAPLRGADDPRLNFKFKRARRRDRLAEFNDVLEKLNREPDHEA